MIYLLRHDTLLSSGKLANLSGRGGANFQPHEIATYLLLPQSQAANPPYYTTLS